MREIEIRRILCPTDFSDFGERALALAISIARWQRAVVTILHVRPPEPTGHEPLERPHHVPEMAERRLLSFVRQGQRAGVTVETLVREGDATREILACATRRPVALIAMGTHGRSGFERWVLGSVAEKVLRKAACPVLTVGPGMGTGAHSWDPILCAVDFSTPSRAALDYALAFQRAARARLEVLHVVEALPPVATDAHPDIDVGAYRRWLIDDAYRALHELVAEAERSAPVGENVTFGKAYAEILRVARDQECGLVVLGARGRGAVDLALFGSTTNQVVRAASCPVLSVGEG
jgi:nucleotide-binding universal stress UspA family protein